jgi:hypothetical protein
MGKGRGGNFCRDKTLLPLGRRILILGNIPVYLGNFYMHHLRNMKDRKFAGCRLLVQSICTALVLTVSLGRAAAQPARTFSHPDRIRYDSQCLTIDGKDVFIYSGAFHYFRCPKELWPDRFQKIKEAGFNTVETYIPWNWCEQQMPAGTNDFSKVELKDIDDWLTMAEQYGFYIIVRPGPYICSEWDTGGFPQWLLTKKPETPLRSEGWLRSDDPVYLAWSKHWYDAVCPVIARHQITRKAPGQPGVILFQVENEYDFPHFPDEVKINQVKALAQYAWADGIDVPLISCWTHQVRGSTDPVLRQIFDCCNFYPRWNVDSTGRDMRRLRRTQPDAPMATTELQGGWFAQVGGKLSEDQDGVTASQINNLTLYVIQNGETILNYYMLFGGTNPDDWTSRDLPTTYDYNAPIRECGGVGDRYQRVKAIGLMLQQHGADLVRSQYVTSDVTTAQKDVTVVERRAPDGSRYFFVRTSQHEEPRQGTATVQESGNEQIVFNYNLEPFGAKVLYLPAGATNAEQGVWLPKEPPAIDRPADVPAGVAITVAKMMVDPGPAHWTRLKPGEALASAGVDDSHFIFYRADVRSAAGANLEVVHPEGDGVLALVNGKLVEQTGGHGSNSIFGLQPGKNAVRLLYENHGHGNFGSVMENASGILAVRKTGDSTIEPLSFGRPAGDMKGWWKPELKDSKWTTIPIGRGNDTSSANSELTWYRMNFSLPSPQAGEWVPWRLHLAASGNGFLYLNGHPLGRYWDIGPQHDFFLPECWLHFGDGQTNNLTLNLRPTKNGEAIASAVVEPYAQFAEKR